MRIPVVLIVSLSLFNFTMALATTKIKSAWLSTAVEIDGADRDWTDVKVTKIKSLDAALRMANQDSTLYILVQFNRPETAGKALMGGMTIWFDKERHNGIRYRGTFAVADALQKMADAGTITARADRRFDAVMNLGKLMVIRENKGFWVGGLETPTLAFSGLRNGVFNYEFKVPLRLSDDVPFGVPAQPGDRIVMCLQVGRGRGGFAPVDMMPSGNAEMGARAGRGGGGMRRPGGGMRGSGGGFGVQEEWLRVDLAGGIE